MPGLPGWSVEAALDVMGTAGISAAVLSVSSPGVRFGAASLAENRAARDLDTTRCVVDLALGGTLARYPRIRWIVPHAGAVLPVVAHRVAGMSALAGTPVDMPAVLAGLYYDLAGPVLPVALGALLEIAGPGRLLYGSDFPFTPAPAVERLSAALREAPALHNARLEPAPGSAAAALFPRLQAAVPMA